MARPVVQLVATGGTIAMTGSPARPALSGDELVQAIPDLAEVADLRVEQLSNVPGVNLTPQAMARALSAASAGLGQGAVITQGTDTIEETAELAHLTWEHDEPLVITGAIRTGGSTGSDGPRNLLDAVTLAASGQHLGPVVVFDGLVHPADQVVKSHSWRSDAFSSQAPLAEIREGSVHIRRPPDADRRPITVGNLDAHVPIIAAAAGMDSRALEQDADGLVLIALGAGHLPETMLEGVDRALARGIPVVVCARPERGGTLERTYGFVGSETDLAQRGVILAGEASPWKARIRLLVALSRAKDPRELFIQMRDGGHT
jgi:L-asparaginase